MSIVLLSLATPNRKSFSKHVNDRGGLTDLLIPSLLEGTDISAICHNATENTSLSKNLMVIASDLGTESLIYSFLASSEPLQMEQSAEDFLV